jgi:Domain of unknown function (DUF1963)
MGRVEDVQGQLWDSERVAAEARQHVAAERVDEIVASVAPGWVLEDAAHDGQACVRVGGEPRMADDEPWPQNDGGLPLTFVAEVDLDALPPIGAGWEDPRPSVLRTGLLRLFADLGAEPYGSCGVAALLRPDARGAARRGAPKWPEEARRNAGEDAVFVLPEARATAWPFLTLPESLPGLNDTFPDEGAGESYRDLTYRIRVGQEQGWLKDLMRDGPDPWSLCHLFGHATSVQDDVRYSARHHHPETELSDWTTVLGLHSGWGGLEIFDGGAYWVLVPTDDLTEGRWERAVFDSASC